MLKFVFNWAPKVNEIVGNTKGLRSKNFRTPHKNAHLEWCMVFYGGGQKSGADQEQGNRYSSISVYLTNCWPIDKVRATISLSVATCPGKPSLACHSDDRDYSVETGWTARDFIPACLTSIPDSILVTADKRIVITCIVSIDERRLNNALLVKEVNGVDITNEEKNLIECMLTGRNSSKMVFDVTLNSNNGHMFYGYRSVLCEKSSYFKSLFNRNPEAKSIHLDVDDETLIELLYYFYTNKFSENLKNVALKCYKIAGMLELWDLQKQSEQFALHSLNVENCIDCLLFTENFPELKKLRSMSISIIVENYASIKRTKQWKTICNYSHLLEAILDKVCSSVLIGVACTGDCIHEKC